MTFKTKALLSWIETATAAGAQGTVTGRKAA
jgi:hypothetical protein